MSKPTIKDILFWLFSLYFTILFVDQGWKKFDPEGFWSGAFERWGYPTWFMFFIGFLEVAGGILILFPRVNGYGALTLAAVMLGAFITRLIHGMSISDGVSIAFYLVAMTLLAYEKGTFDKISTMLKKAKTGKLNRTHSSN